MQRGFTLIEMIVAITVFSVITAIASGFFVSASQAQRRSLAYQELLDQTSYLLEYASRSLRMAKKELSAPDCLSQNGLNYEKAEILPGKIGLKFINYQGVCQGFFLEDQQLKFWRAGETSGTSLTSNRLSVNSFDFTLYGKSQNDDEQPRAVIFLDIQGRENARIEIQTAVSQRNLDIRQ